MCILNNINEEVYSQFISIIHLKFVLNLLKNYKQSSHNVHKFQYGRAELFQHGRIDLLR